jgi:hypothetical protein
VTFSREPLLNTPCWIQTPRGSNSRKFIAWRILKYADLRGDDQSGHIYEFVWLLISIIAHGGALKTHSKHIIPAKDKICMYIHGYNPF